MLFDYFFSSVFTDGEDKRSLIYRILFLLFPLVLSPFIYNPLGLLLLIFIAALRSILLICSIFGTIYGLITFLIYVTGMLVLFSYILSMFPNFSVRVPHEGLWIRVPCVWGFRTWLYLDLPFREESLVTALVGGSNFSVFLTLVVALLFRLVVISVLCYKGRRPLRSR